MNINCFAKPICLLATTTLFSSLLTIPSNFFPKTIALAQSASTPDRKTQADQIAQQGMQQASANQFREAVQSWQQSLSIYREIGDRQGEANSLGLLGLAHGSLGETERAIDLLEQSLAIQREIGNRQGIISTLGGLGTAYDSLGQYELAIYFFGETLAIARETGNRQAEAKSLDSLANSYRYLRQYERAIDLYQQALAIARETNNRQTATASLGGLGIAHASLGQYERAVAFFQEYLTLAREMDDRKEEAKALGNLGALYNSLSQYERAIDYHRQQLAIAQEIGDRQQEIIALGNIGIAYSSLNQDERAIDFHNQSLVIAREIGDRQRESESLNNIGSVYYSLGQYERAIDFHEQSLGLVREIGDRKGESISLGNLGAVYAVLGQYERALNFREQSLAIMHEIGDRRGEVDAIGNLGTTYQSLGQFERAIDLHMQQLALSREISSRQEEANALGNLGNAYYSLGQQELAIEAHQQALAILREVKDREGESLTLTYLGNIYNVLGQYETALGYHQESLALAREIGNHPAEILALNNLGLSYNYLGQYEQALNLFEQVLAAAKNLGDRRGESLALGNLGMGYFKTNQFPQAENFLRQSIITFESLRTNLSDAQLIALADTQPQAYTNLNRALIAQNNPVEALAISERSRARAFVLQLANRLATHSPESAQQIAAFSDFPDAAKLQQIARDTDTTLVEYAQIFDQALYIWVISPTGDIQFRSVEFEGSGEDGLAANPIATLNDSFYRSTPDPSALTELVADVRATIIPEATNAVTNTDQLKALHEVLIDPIADLLPTDPNAKVVFIPQGNLFLVPFAALQDADGTYLVEKHTILTAPSIQVFGLVHEAASTAGAHGGASLPGDNALIVGNPTMPTVWARTDSGGFAETQLPNLSGAKAEAEAIGTFFNIPVLTGSQATEAAIKQQLPTARLIHLATHGLLDYGDPTAYGTIDVPGAIALAPGNGEDGLLTSAEILEMDLQADLAILSACDTGRGRITGDGVVGLSRALITAGVPSVVVSLWSVPDAPTAELMTAFYRELGEGQDKAQALRQAMLTTMEQHPDPRMWAAFTLIGAAE